MNRIHILDNKIIVEHYQRFRQYTQSESWIKWYVKVARFKGIRTSKILLEYKKSDAKVLDLGSGLGMTFVFISQVFKGSVACDTDENSVKATKELLAKSGLKRKVLKYDGIKLPFKDNVFDIVTSIEVIEHASNPEQMLSEIARVLKPDGILHITTANKWWPYEPHYKLFFLSYLPDNWADFYVRISGKGENYQGIKLPSYDQFKKMVSKYFTVNDITLDIIKDYRKYDFDKERGSKVVLVGKFLLGIDLLKKNRATRWISGMIEHILLNISLGWLFIAKPKK